MKPASVSINKTRYNWPYFKLINDRTLQLELAKNIPDGKRIAVTLDDALLSVHSQTARSHLLSMFDTCHPTHISIDTQSAKPVRQLIQAIIRTGPLLCTGLVTAVSIIYFILLAAVNDLSQTKKALINANQSIRGAVVSLNRHHALKRRADTESMRTALTVISASDGIINRFHFDQNQLNVSGVIPSADQGTFSTGIKSRLGESGFTGSIYFESLDSTTTLWKGRFLRAN